MDGLCFPERCVLTPTIEKAGQQLSCAPLIAARHYGASSAPFCDATLCYATTAHHLFYCLASGFYLKSSGKGQYRRGHIVHGIYRLKGRRIPEKNVQWWYIRRSFVTAPFWRDKLQAWWRPTFVLLQHQNEQHIEFTHYCEFDHRLINQSIEWTLSQGVPHFDITPSLRTQGDLNAWPL